MRRLAALVLLLSACAPAQQVVDDVARAQAKSVVTPIVERNFPGMNASRVSDCAIDNASAGEILVLARASAARTVSPEAVQVATDILARPETISCIAESGVLRLPGGARG